MRVAVYGVKEVLAKLASIPADARAASSSALPIAATVIAAAAIAEAPKDAGDLQAGIEARATAGGGAEVESEALHSIHVEYGTAEQAAQPFLRPAMDRFGPKAILEAARYVNKSVGG